MAHTPGNINMSERLMDSMRFDILSFCRNVLQYCHSYLHWTRYVGHQQVQWLINLLISWNAHKTAFFSSKRLIGCYAKFKKVTGAWKKTIQYNCFQFDWQMVTCWEPWITSWNILNTAFLYVILSEINSNILQYEIGMHTLLVDIFNFS